MERDDLWVAVIDYGVGNLRNVYKALEAAGATARIVTEPGELAGAPAIVLPGVGAFGDAAANLRRAGFEAPLLDAIAAGIPLLGICVGMQLLFNESEEMGCHAGLGVIPGRVVRFASEHVPGTSGRLLKVPQIGWNQLHHAGVDPLLAGVPDGAYAYFVHSYYCAPADSACVVAATDFGIRYASVVRRGNVWGIQCHPEKSQAVGLRILRNFVEIANGMGGHGDTGTRGHGDAETRRHGDTETRRRGDTETRWHGDAVVTGNPNSPFHLVTRPPGQERRPMSIQIYPAIDLRRGQVVRLRQGDPAAQTVFGDDPAAVARRWVEQGAEWLHVVNLDGAFAAQGQSQGLGQNADLSLNLSLNLQRLAEIRAATDLPIQFGGGLRTVDDVARVLALGATRVVLGTVAVRQPAVVAAALARFGAERIVVGIDARDGWVATHGWQETSALDALTVARRMRDLGVLRIVFTDIARDGTLTGVNVASTAALARESGLKVIASGGVGGLDDIRALTAHVADGIEGVIVGQAIYTGAINLKEAIAVAR